MYQVANYTINIGFANEKEATPEVDTTANVPLETLNNAQTGDMERSFPSGSDFVTSEQDTDDDIRQWLADSGYDLGDSTADFYADSVTFN